jgi:hypothetical protein
MDWLSGSAPFVMWGAIIVFNIAIIQLLRTCLVGIDIQAALSEKGPVAVVQTSMTKQTVPTDAGGQLQTEEKKEKQSTPGPSGETSYSRVSGMVGAVVLACFIWALGNVVLFKAFTAPAEVGTMLQGLSGFFLAGASLFAPYAFNQLSAAFKPN